MPDHHDVGVVRDHPHRVGKALALGGGEPGRRRDHALTALGYDRVDLGGRCEAARSLGASELQIFRYVVFPSALAEIFTGARLAIGIVYATLIAAEIIAGSAGLGWMILDAGRFLRSDYVVVGIILIGLMGLALDRLLRAIVASPSGVRAGEVVATLAPAALNAVIAHAGDCRVARAS